MKSTFVSRKSVVEKVSGARERGEESSGLRKQQPLVEEFEVCSMGYFYSLFPFPEPLTQLLIRWCLHQEDFKRHFGTVLATPSSGILFHCQLQRMAQETTGPEGSTISQMNSGAQGVKTKGSSLLPFHTKSSVHAFMYIWRHNGKKLYLMTVDQRNWMILRIWCAWGDVGWLSRKAKHPASQEPGSKAGVGRTGRSISAVLGHQQVTQLQQLHGFWKLEHGLKLSLGSSFSSLALRERGKFGWQHRNLMKNPIYSLGYLMQNA